MTMRIRIPFKLETTEQIAPVSGEQLGGDLRAAGDALLNRMSAPSEDGARRVAVLWNLAADAFVAGAAASIGHNRARRYEEAARELRQNADSLMAGTY
jgi:hypothetical protein